jgi:lysophospholipase L1-like esterase
MSFSPNDISGLQLWLDASDPMYTASYAAKATALNDAVSIWPDKSENGHAMVVNGTPPKYDPTGLNGHPTLKFDAAGYFTKAAFFTALYDKALSVFVVSKIESSNGILIGSGLSSVYILKNEDLKRLTISIPSLTPNNITTISPHDGTGLSTITGFIWNGAKTLIETGNFNTQSGTNSTASLIKLARTGDLSLAGLAVAIGADTGGTFKWPGTISEVLIFNTALSDEQRSKVVNYLSDKWSIPTKRIVVCCGNSLTSGTGSTTGENQALDMTTLVGDNYPNKLVAALGHTNYSIRVDAYAGRALSQMVVEAPLVDFFYSQSLGIPIALVWEVTNELSQHKSAGGAIDLLIKYCNSRRKRGFKVAVMTCLPTQVTGIYAGFESDRLIVNDYVRENYLSFADKLIDVAADVRLQTPTDTTYFNADKLHLNSVGYQVVADICVPIIATM